MLSPPVLLWQALYKRNLDRVIPWTDSSQVPKKQIKKKKKKAHKTPVLVGLYNLEGALTPYVTFTITSQSWHYYYTQFIDDETKNKDSSICPETKWQR